MTKSTITRERLAKIKSWRETYGAGSNVMLPAEEAEELARMALGAMDSEPDCKERKLFCSTDTARMRKVISVSAGTDVVQTYRHAQPAMVVPEEIKHRIGGLDWGWEGEFNRGWNACRAAMLATAQHDTPALNSVQSVVTVPGKWIPVCERMPLTPSADCEYSDIEVNVFDGERVFTAHYATGSQPQPWGCWVDTYAKITHWQPLPAAPQEVKGE
ncbi:DUF551 domain-containing protein [Klebsiella quasipneumoniae]|uniref:DUF551 domain-containing protein n=1 Tax=Klebsiella quasipneumoniae TaxID=1463165 RepID=UPI00294A1348|nr:DUF551 domain-containing protein [Klebsiella quasipneumoniae]MDV5431863.1 DUF551 domain-containing protein [Klebsiella quasipneumoniae]